MKNGRLFATTSHLNFPSLSSLLLFFMKLISGGVPPSFRRSQGTPLMLYAGATKKHEQRQTK
jgi:hypothetical protein